MDTTNGKTALAPTISIAARGQDCPRGKTPNRHITGAMTMAPGTRRRIRSSSTVKLPCTANRVTSINAAQIVTVTSAAASPSVRVFGRCICRSFMG